MGTHVGYAMHPSIHGDAIVFVCEEDLWTVPAGGGVARRLTTAPGVVSFPRFSPDGSRIAYAARDEGPTETYVMDALGGPSTRLTFFGSLSQPVAWRPDGQAVIVRSNAGQPFMGALRLHEVPVDGGPSTEIPVGLAREIAYEPRGKGRVLGINTGDPARWKRYRGGTAGRLWVDRTGDGAFAALIRLDGNVSHPMWIGRRIYFVSDHEGHGNLYSCTSTGRDLRRHTHHEDHYARFPTTDGRRIVYHAGADVHCFDVKADESVKVSVALRSARAERARKFVDAARYLESADLHPDGHSLAVVARGGAFTAAHWEGAPLRHGPVSSVRHRLVHWLRDGKRLVGVTDEKGEEGLAVWRADGEGRTKRISGDFGRALDLVVAPAGSERVALANQRHEVWIVDLGTGRRLRVDRSEHDRIGGMAWSPDGRWLAYAFPTSLYTSTIRLYDVEKQKKHDATRSEFEDFHPSFDPAGTYLYFLSRRVFDPVYDNQLFDLGFPRAVQPCLVPLAADTPSPFAAATREPRPLAGGANGKPKGTKKPARTKVDLRGIADRVVAFPVPEARYLRVCGAPGRALLLSHPVAGSLGSNWATAGEPEARCLLQVHKFEEGKTETLVDGVTDVTTSLDGRTLLVRVGNRLRVLAARTEPKEISAKSEPGRESGWVDLGRLRVQVEPGLEWRQMFDEAWRLQRDQFWDPDMSAIQWKDVHRRYAPLVDRVSSRSEFSDLIWELQGELGTSHNYEMGGDYRPSPTWFQGMLGADLEWSSRTKRWVIRRIPRGDSWMEGAASPLAAPGLDVRVGDHVLAVGGRTVSRTLSPAACLVHEAGRAVVLTVQRPGRPKRRVTVQTLRAEFALRYRDWVEANRARVHAATRGRVGYVHVPNMGPVGYAEFHRYYKQEFDHLGLIVDVRWNGGGHVSQLLLEKLARKRVGYGCPRWRAPEPYPGEAPMGPMVALTNENAGSDGDIFSHSFKLLGLGPLIGKRTWGGVVGIWPRHALVDGTITTQSEFGHWFHDVEWGVENYGTDPDIEVDIKPQDWAAGRDPQLDRALQEIEAILRRVKPRVPDFSDKPRLAPPRLARP